MIDSPADAAPDAAPETSPPVPEPMLSSTALPRLHPPVAPSEHRDSQRLASSALLIIIGAAALLFLFDHMRTFLVPLAMAVLLNLVLGPVVRRLDNLGLPSAVSASVVLLTLVAAFTGLILLAAPAVEEWMRELPAVLEALRLDVLDNPKVDALLNAKMQAEATSAELGNAAAVPVRVDQNDTQQWLAAGTGFLVNTVIVLFLAFMMLAAGDRFRRRIRRALEDSPLQQRMADAAVEVETNVSTYVLTIGAINTALGVAVGITMWLLDLDNPLVWGVLAGLLNFIPYIGPMLTAVLIALGGYASWGGVDGLIIPPLAYLAINAIEAFGITPFLLGRRLRLSPVATLVSVLFWTWLWGLGGALIAIPMLVVIYVVCSHLSALRPVAMLITR